MKMELLFELPTAEESRKIAKKAFDTGLKEELERTLVRQLEIAL